MKKINWKYALGETLIVIIGISIAFGLNNWNENRKDQHLRRQYLEGLMIDINKEITHLEAKQEQIRSKVRQIEEVLQFMYNGTGEEEQISKQVFEVAQVVTFQPENTTYRAMINSGDMRLLDDFQLRQAVEAHYNNHQLTLNGYRRVESINKNYLGDFFIREIDYQGLYRGEFSFLKKPLLHNILSSLRGAYMIAMEETEKCLRSNENLQEAIGSVLQ